MSTLDPSAPRAPTCHGAADTATAPRPPAPLTAPPTEPAPRRGPASGAANRWAWTLGHSLRRRWLLAALFGVFCGWLVGSAVWTFYPAQHAAEVWLKFSRAPRGAFGDGEFDADGAPRTQATLLKSPLLLEAALRQPELEELLERRPRPQPLNWLDQHVSTDASAGPSILRVTAVSDRADEPPLLVNAMAQAFVREVDARQQAHLAQTKEAYQRAHEELRARRAALAQRDDPRPAKAEADLQATRLERKRTQAELDVLLANPAVPPAPVTDKLLDEAVKTDPGARDWRKEADRLEEQILERERIAALGTADATVRRLRGQLARWEEKIATRRAEIAAALERQAADKARDEFQAKRAALELMLAGLGEVEKRLEAERKALADETGGPEADALREEVAAKQEAVHRLGGEVQELEAEAAAGGCVTRLGETRTVPEVNRGRRLAATGTGAALTVLLVALLLVWLESGDKRVRSAGELALGAPVPLLGEIPDLKPGPGSTDFSKPGPEAEAVDVLRTLLLRRTGGGPIILLVTSAVGGEGKTTLASQLAASLARAWRKTLLVDGDLRKPAVHRAFHAAAEPGLSEVLRGDCEPAEAIQPTALSRLWVLSAGCWNRHAVQALAQQDAAVFLRGLRDRYEFIIVDSAPLLPVADTLLLSQYVDAVVLAVRCGTSQLPAVHAAQLRLNTMNVPFLGAVVLGGSK
jgi:succinoglycan biosynthesis transport protein ExoP